MQAQLESEQFPMGMRDQWRRGDSSDGFWWRDDGSFSSQAQERSGAVHQVSKLNGQVLVCAWRVRRVSLAFPAMRWRGRGWTVPPVAEVALGLLMGLGIALRWCCPASTPSLTGFVQS